MIELKNNALQFHFPQVHPDAQLSVEFQRTLRIPDDDKEYPLPAGLGRFPLSHVDDFENVPGRWKAHGGVLMPMWQAEAAWINFSGDYPMAVKVAAGKINAVTGDTWTNELSGVKQDYVVIPGQQWLDGFCVGEGLIRQFVAMSMGEGFTAEEQITGEADHGGLQIIAYPMRAESYEAILAERRRQAERESHYFETRVTEYTSHYGLDFGMAPGGLMRQEIYTDHHGIDVWDQSAFSRCFVHLANGHQYHELTGQLPPDKPPKPSDYRAAGMPWFDYYQADLEALGGPSALMQLDSVASKFRKEGKSLPDNQPIDIPHTTGLGDSRHQVREGW